MQQHPFRAIFALLALLGFGWISSAQTVYSEDFENETPFDANNLCSPGNEYAPTDGSWALGPACAVTTNGIPKLVDVAGDTYLEYNQKYPADSEVWNSKSINVSAVSDLVVQFDARSVGGLESYGPYLDEFALYAVLDGAEQATPLVAFSGHVDGSGDSPGDNSTVLEASFTESVSTLGATELSLRIRIKISGGDGSESYQIGGMTVCVDADADDVCDECEPFEFSADLSDYSVECLDDLPTECDGSVTANRGVVSCGVAVNQEGRTQCTGTTPDGVGHDYAFVLFDVDGDPTDDRYFDPVGDGLSLIEYNNGTAIVSGQLVDQDDPAAILNLYVFYEDGTAGVDWTGAFKSDISCTLTPEITDAWTLYYLNSGLSFAVGEGTLEGTTLQLGHMSAFGFQVGEMANDRNCNYGAGGWLSYSGSLNGETIVGGTGDLLLDLDCTEEIINTCGDGEASATLVYTVYDAACGDVLQVEQEVTRTDTEAPEFDNAPDDIEVSCVDGLPAVPTVTASDNCEDSDPTAVTVTFAQTPQYDVDCIGTYKVDRTWLAEDCSGNVATHTQTITVVDDTAPSIAGGSDYDAECDGAGNPTELNAWLAGQGGATATDDCGTVTWSHDFEGLSNDCGETGSATVTFTAKDDCMNASTITLTFTIEDNVNPSIDTEASNQTVECDGAGNTAALNAWLGNNGGAIASDICSGVTWSNNFTSLSDDCGATGSATVIFTASDDCGNTSSTTATFTIEDTTDPSIDTPAADQTVECDGAGNTAALNAWLGNNGGAVASDLCSGVTWSNNYTGLSNDCGETGSATVTFTATDDCGRTSSTTATFTIQDTTDPSIDTPAADQTVECDGVGNPAALNTWLGNNGGAVASDLCSGVTWSHNYTGLSDDCGETGSATVTFTATDDCGRTSSTTATFTIEDTTNPSIDTMASDETVECDGAGNTAALNAWIASHGGASASDVCSGVSWSNDFEGLSDDCGETGSATVTFTATDACGRTSSTTATFTIEDTTDPSLTGTASDETVECDGAGNTAALNAWLGNNGGASATDICSGVTWTNNFTSLSDDCGATGSATVTFTATDDCNNTVTTTATFTIEDTVDPEWDEFIPYAFAACEDLTDPTDPSQVPITASDDCSDVVYSIEAYQLSGGCPGTWMRVWTATDACGNASVEAEQYVQLYDDVKPVPVITCPADFTVDKDDDCNADVSVAAAGSATATATDNCTADADITIVITHVDGPTTETCTGAYTFTRTWTATATDECDNEDSVTCAQTITVEDNTAPEISGGADETVECDGAGNTGAFEEWLDSHAGATATDNCTEPVSWTNNYTECDGGLGMFTTYRQGSWGSTNSNNPAASLLDADFDSVFPNGVTVGCGSGFELTFTSADAVDTYLPCTGGAQDLVLTHGGTNPTEAAEDPTCWDNALVSHLLTAKLNVAFDAADEDFSASDVALGDLVVQEGPFAGMPISEVIAISDEVLGDCRNDYTPQECRVTLRLFNKNYSNGTNNQGYMQIAGCFTDGCGATGQAIVTFTATDDCGNASTVQATFTIEDTTAPTLAGDIEVDVDCGDWSCDADALEALGLFTVTEDCGGYTLEATCIAGSGSCVGPIPGYTVTIVATDDCGNESDPLTQFVDLVDDEAPVVTITACAGAFTATVDGSCTADLDPATTGMPTATSTDNCDASPSIDYTYVDGAPSSTCTGSYSFTRTWTATAEDHCMNEATATCDQVITVTDNEAPSISGTPADITQTNDAGNCSAVVNWTAPTASDNCGVTSFTSTHSSGDAFAVGTTTVTYTAMDCAGNTTTSSFTVTVTDDEDPVISGTPANITQTNDPGNCSASVTWVDPTASDNCAVATFTATHIPGNTFPVGTTTVTYTATDIHGNTTTSTFNVTVTDDEAPSISGTPADITQTNDAGNCSAVVTWTEPTASDNCAVASLTSSHSPGATFPVGETTVTYTATDIHGNVTTSSFTVTVTDDEAPSISGTPADISQTNDTGNCSAVVTWTAPTAADNCGVPSFTSTHDSGDTFAVGTTTVTYTAMDAAGNTTTSSFTVTVTDDEAPSISGTPANITVSNDAGNCSAVVNWVAPTSSDNCAVTTFTSTHSSGDAFAVGTTTVTYTAMDAAGNTTTASFNITVTDDEDPVISGTPADITQTNDAGNCSAVVTWTEPTASDNCAVATFTSSHSPGDTFPVGETTVTYTATDIHGNTTTSTFDVTVTDDEAPSISGTPADITQTNDAGNCSAVVTWTEPTASDNCAVATLTSSHSPGATFPVGETTVTYTATDIHGNVTASSFTVTVTDDEAPSISSTPADINQTNDTGNCSAVVTWTAPTASDNCGVTSFTSTHDSGDTFAVGTTTVTYIAKDAAGNTTTASFNITVTDDEDPVISGTPANITQTNDAGNCSAQVTWVDPTASDNCAVATFTSTHIPGNTFPVGTTTVTYTATDIHGNTTTSTFNVTVTDDEAPSISGTPADITQTNDAGNCSAVVTWTEPTATDNCAVATLTSSHSPGATFPVGETTVTYTATDIHGNVTTSSFTVTVTDDEAPSISGTPADISQTNDTGNCSAVVTWTAPTAADNCGVTSFTSTYDSGDTFAVGTTTVTYTAMDAAGNTTTSSFTVTVTDDEAPSISDTPADITQGNDPDLCAASVTWTAPTAADNCGVTSFTSTHSPGDLFAVGTTTVTYTAMDAAGNTTTASFTVTVNDTQAPQFTETCGLMNDGSVDVCCEDLSGTVTIPEACETEAQDNCDDDVTITSTETPVGPYAPGDGVESYCESSTPEAYEDGEACNGLDPHSFSLFNFDGQPRVDFTSVGVGVVAQMTDGTWVLTQDLANEAGTGMLSIEVTYGAAVSWDDWYVAGQTNYKRDCGVLIDDHENWDYRILQSGTVSGSGDYDGLELTLAHAPMNQYYAFQVGVGANNQNNNYGYSGWIMASGTANTGTDTEEAVFFSGDLFGDLDCCLPWSIEVDYTATDDAGNSTDFSYTIEVNGEDCMDDDDAMVSGGQDDDHTPVILGGAGDLTTGKSPIRVTNLQPNPTNDWSLLGFTVTQNMRLRVDMFTMDGILVTELFDGVASPNVNHTLDIEASALQSGMYQIRLSSSQYLVVKKLLVTE